MNRTSAHAGCRVLAVAMFLSFVSDRAIADGPKPRKPDSPARTRPEEVQFAVEVVPQEVVPGSKVTIKVVASLDKNWHIYDFAKKSPEEGPISTTFDFFDLQGLKPVGDWKSDRVPLKKHDQEFPSVDFFYYFEDAVTWSIELEVPADAKPGKLMLKNQVYFQICSNKTCLPPTRITLPDAIVIVKEKPPTN